MKCDECDALWLDPRDTAAGAALFSESPAYRVPGCSFSVLGASGRWATREEIAAEGWQEFVQGEGQAIDEQ